jgi:TatD DNase family protein
MSDQNDIRATMMDTHCHLNFERYDDDRHEVIQRAKEAGVSRVLIPAVDTTTAREALNLAEAYPGTIYAAVGVHPNSTADFDTDTLHEVEALAGEPGVVAIGEIGLDYYWDKSPVEKQKLSLRQQLRLAAELELPVIIHNREAGGDVIAILREWVETLPETLKARPGVLHSFSAPQNIADEALKMGFYLGFTGPVTFKNADDLRRIASTVPLDKILVETDGPFLTPEPHRGKRNEPGYIPHIVERLAALKQVSSGELAQHSTDNAERLFLFDS